MDLVALHLETSTATSAPFRRRHCWSKEAPERGRGAGGSPGKSTKSPGGPRSIEHLGSPPKLHGSSFLAGCALRNPSHFHGFHVICVALVAQDVDDQVRMQPDTFKRHEENVEENVSACPLNSPNIVVVVFLGPTAFIVQYQAKVGTNFLGIRRVGRREIMASWRRVFSGQRRGASQLRRCGVTMWEAPCPMIMGQVPCRTVQHYNTE